MNSIVYVGMDVHKDSFTLTYFDKVKNETKKSVTFPSDVKNVVKYIENIKAEYDFKVDIVCGYEAGCLGYSLLRDLTRYGITCIILAPSTMAVTNTNRVKTDRKDAGNIARCLAFGTYSAVYVPTEEDNAVKEYVRMRDDHRLSLKKIKQQILSLVLRYGKQFTGGKTYWTGIHLEWLRNLELGSLERETLSEYLATYDFLESKIDRLDMRIEEIAFSEKYEESVKKLICFSGIKTHTALSLIVETGDFRRFDKAEKFAGYLGLVPCENSSGNSIKRGSITKAGNSHLRKLLTEASQALSKGVAGRKSKALAARQHGNTPEVISYADKGNDRLKRKFHKLTYRNVKRNVAVTAIARELSCFVWGMMTDKIS